MPWTLTHPAAVLPLRRLCPWALNFPALVFGSMTPDLGYYINRFDLSNFAHTWAGSFVACVPSGLILLVIFYLFCKPVCYALPAPHREALLPHCPSFPQRGLTWGIILLSLVLGAWTHNFWDAFTHKEGWFVTRIWWLQQPAFQIGSTTIHVFLVLQELSTLVGLVIIVFAYGFWLRRQGLCSMPDSEPDGWRYLFWTVIAVVALIVSLPLALQDASSFPPLSFPFFRSILFRGAVYGSMVVVPLSLAGTAMVYGCRPRKPTKSS
ncbi:MAG: DUF4184 family protein [Verrucomicrobiota bacterium]|nr:DUF4184 family protein [Verrucomicrobiota bacterium]